MVDRNGVQKNETEFQFTLFLFRYGKWHKNPGLVHAHSPFVAQCDQGVVQKQESFFNSGCADTHTSDKPLGFDVDSYRGEASLY